MDEWDDFPRVSWANIAMLFREAGYPNPEDTEAADREEGIMLTVQEMTRRRE